MENLHNLTPEIPERDDPLAIRVGIWAGADDIPAEGWPDTLQPEVIERILSLLPPEDQI